MVTEGENPRKEPIINIIRELNKWLQLPPTYSCKTKLYCSESVLYESHLGQMEAVLPDFFLNVILADIY